MQYENVDLIENFLEKYILPKLIQEETEDWLSLYPQTKWNQLMIKIYLKKKKVPVSDML